MPDRVQKQFGDRVRSLRKKLGIKAGSKLGIEERNSELILRPITIDYFENLAGALKSKGKLTKALLNSRKEDYLREL